MSRQFFVRLAVLTALLHAYVGLRLLVDLPGGILVALGGWAYLAFSSLAIPFGFHGRRFRSRRLGDAAAWVGYLCMGVFSSLFVLSVLRDVVLALAWMAGEIWPGLVQLERLGRSSAEAALLVTAIVTLWGLLNARRRARVVHVDVPIRDLPDGLQGFTIAQISDVHVGPTIKQGYLSAIVDATNALHPDLVALTGDLVDGSVEDLSPHVAPLARLSARHGVFCVLGNHEYYSGADAWVIAFRKLGLRVLLNEGAVVTHQGARILIGGVTDYSAHRFDPAQRSDPQRALIGAQDGDLRVLLAHQPRSALAAAEAGFHLQLSGHTHGGQFLPWNFFVPLQQPIVAGLERIKDLWVYVSRGSGYWGPPIRFGAPSEITLLHLRAV